MLKRLLLYGIVVFTNIAYCSIDQSLFERASYVKSELAMQGKVKSELLKTKALVIAKNSYNFTLKYNAIVAKYKTTLESLCSKIDVLERDLLKIKSSSISSDEIAFVKNSLLEIKESKKALQAILRDIPGFYI